MGVGPPRTEPIGQHLVRASKAVSRAFDEALAAPRCSHPVWQILLSLQGRRHRAQRELAEAVGIEGPTLTHHLNRLELAGLVVRMRDPQNRRVHLVDLTPAGQAGSTRCWPPWWRSMPACGRACPTTRWPRPTSCSTGCRPTSPQTHRHRTVRDLTFSAWQLNHTIVHSRDRRASAAFLAGVLGVEVAPDWGPFTPVHLGNGVSLDYEQTDRAIVPQHYAFLVTDAEFDRGLAVVRDGGQEIWADPWLSRPGRSTIYGGRGFYRDPDGHLLELITAPYGGEPGSE